MKIHGMKIHKDNNGVSVDALLGGPEEGHEYNIDHEGGLLTRISFQNGPVKEFGVNGITN